MTFDFAKFEQALARFLHDLDEADIAAPECIEFDYETTNKLKRTCNVSAHFIQTTSTIDLVVLGVKIR